MYGSIFSRELQKIAFNYTTPIVAGLTTAALHGIAPEVFDRDVSVGQRVQMMALGGALGGINGMNARALGEPAVAMIVPATTAAAILGKGIGRVAGVSDTTSNIMAGAAAGGTLGSFAGRFIGGKKPLPIAAGALVGAGLFGGLGAIAPNG